MCSSTGATLPATPTLRPRPRERSSMKQREQALLLLNKAAEDEALLDEVLESGRVSDAVFGFHCQQAAEKLLKALLSELGVRFGKTHNLKLLMDLLQDAGQSLPQDLAELDALTPFGAFFRYEYLTPQVSLDRKATRAVVRILRASD